MPNTEPVHFHPDKPPAKSVLVSNALICAYVLDGFLYFSYSCTSELDLARSPSPKPLSCTPLKAPLPCSRPGPSTMEYHTPTPSFQATGGPAAPPETLHYEQQQQQQQQQWEQPIAGSPFVGTDIRTLKTASETSLREYAALQKQGVGPGSERFRVQGSLAVSDLRALRSDVVSVLRRAEAGRWRNWLLGGVM